MRHRNRPHRQPNDTELKAALLREAELLAAAGDLKSARAKLRAIKSLADRRDLAITAYRRLPMHPMQARQILLRTNANIERYGFKTFRRQPTPAHPSRARERAFARRVARRANAP